MAGARTKVAVVGAGYIADTHLQILARQSDVELTALVDLDPARAAKLAAKHGVARTFSSIAQMLAAGRPDVAHVLVPPELHAAVATELLEAGVGVFIEKPLATTVADAQRLVDLARAKGVALGVNHNNTFHPGFVRLKELVREGRLGRVEHVVGCLSVPLRQLTTRDFSHYMFRTPRNIVFEQAVHPFSQLVDLLGPARSISAIPWGRRELAPGLLFYDTWQIALQHERGTSTLLLSFGRDWAEGFVRALGQDGSVQVDLLRGHVTRLRKSPWPDFWDQRKNAQWTARELKQAGWRNATDYLLSTLKLKERSDLFYVGMRDSISAFHASLHGGPAYPCNGEQGLAVVACCELATKDVPLATPAPPELAAVPAAPVAPATPSALHATDEVLVTGANGFIGTHVVARLLKEGRRVRALVRKPRFVPDLLRQPGVSVVAGDVADAAAVDAAVKGARAAIHLATGSGDTWAEIERGMLGGTKNLAEACVRHGVKRFLFTSTIAAYYLGDGDAAPVTEETPLDPRTSVRGLYARGKIATEGWLSEYAAQSGLEVVTARPGFVVGSDGAPQHSGIGLWTRDTQVFGWGRGDRPLPFVLVGDVADALVRALEHPQAAGRSYNLIGDVALTAREWVEALRRGLGRDFELHPQTIASWYAEECFKYLIKVAIRRPGATAPSWRDLATRTAANPFDNARPKRELGWSPVADRAQFLAAALPRP